MKTTNNTRGFSLIELLVALSILAVVAAVIVPRFLNVRTQAAQTATQSQQRTLQRAVQQFLSLGGTIANATASGDILLFLGQTSTVGTQRVIGTAAGQIDVTAGSMTDSGGNFGSSTVSISLGASAAAPFTNGNQAGYYFAKGATAEYADGAGGVYTIAIGSNPGTVVFNVKAGVTGQTATVAIQ